MSIRVQMDVGAIMRTRGLGPSDRVQRALVANIARHCDPYVPMQQGELKKPLIEKTRLVYDEPYARYQYHGKVMGPNIPVGNDKWISRGPKKLTGRDLTYNGAPMRGPYWDKRMMADRKTDVIKDMEIIIAGGKLK